MPHVICTAIKLAKALPIFLALGASATAPALANNQGSGDGGRGGPPERQTVFTYSLMRMNTATLRELSYRSHRLNVDGVIGAYNARHVINALLALPDPTKRLIERLESAPDDAARLEIAYGLIKVYSRKHIEYYKLLHKQAGRIWQAHGSPERSFEEILRDRNNRGPEVQKYFQLKAEQAALDDFRFLLQHVALTHDPSMTNY